MESKSKDRPQVVALTTKHSQAPQLESALPSLHSQKPNDKTRQNDLRNKTRPFPHN